MARLYSSQLAFCVGLLARTGSGRSAGRGPLRRKIIVVRGVYMSDNTLLNVKQVAQYLQLKESTIYSWAQDGKIPAIKIGRTWRFRQADLDAWLERHLQKEGGLEDLA